jgi:hypothetical protein
MPIDPNTLPDVEPPSRDEPFTRSSFDSDVIEAVQAGAFASVALYIVGAAIVPLVLLTMKKSIIAANGEFLAQSEHWQESWMPAVLFAILGGVIGGLAGWRIATVGGLSGALAWGIGGVGIVLVAVVGGIAAFTIFGAPMLVMVWICLGFLIGAGLLGTILATHWVG